MKLLDAGEVLPSEMVLSLVATKLASRECQKSGWVLEGVGTAAAGVDELEEAIVMATEVLVIALCSLHGRLTGEGGGELFQYWSSEKPSLAAPHGGALTAWMIGGYGHRGVVCF